MAEAKFLAAADLHLGRPIASLPDSLREDARTLGPFGALERLVKLARTERVDAVLIAGDVVDDDGAYFEVFSALQDAVRRLDGIPMIAIAGNHDAKVLPRLAEAIDGLTLLGAGGRWQSQVVPTSAGDVEVLGWSFPDSHCRSSPFDAPPPPRAGRRIGLLHGDLDTAGSVYAPFTSAHLREHAADAWLLGHVHAPSAERLAQHVPVGYLGSLCGLDPSEAGPRGAWRVRCNDRGVSLEPVPLAPIAWIGVSVDVSNIAIERLDGAIHKQSCDAADGFEQAEAVGVRLTLTGEHEHWQELASMAASMEPGQPWQHNGRRVFIDKIDCRVTAPLPLERLTQERSAAGRIASLILDLERGEASSLVEAASMEFAGIGGDRNLRVPSIGERDYPLPDARSTLLREARAVLSELIVQREGAT